MPRPGRGDRLALPQRPLHRPLPRAARAEHQADQALQAARRSPAPTGAATRAARCSRASTAPPSSRRRSSRSTSSGSRRRARATTASSAASSACSCSPTWRRASPFWLPKGTRIWNELTALWRASNVERGYREVRTPILYDVELWKTSGHWDKYRDNMYFTEVEDRQMGLKPMNCPGAHPDLRARAPLLPRPADPLRRAGPRAPPRAERRAPRPPPRARTSPRTTPTSSAPRSRSRTRCSRCLDFGFFIYDLFGFEPRLELSTRPEKRIGTDEMWDRAEDALAGRAREPRARVRR